MHVWKAQRLVLVSYFERSKRSDQNSKILINIPPATNFQSRLLLVNVHMQTHTVSTHHKIIYIHIFCTGARPGGRVSAHPSQVPALGPCNVHIFGAVCAYVWVEPCLYVKGIREI